MKILLVEDNVTKSLAIQNLILNEFPDDTFKEANSLISGLRMARDFEPDFILLDMSLPNHPPSDRGMEAADMRPFAGKEFLIRVRRMTFDTKVLVVSMFETFGVAPNLITLTGLDDEMKTRYPDIYLSAIYYSSSESEWQTEIIKYHKLIEASI